MPADLLIRNARVCNQEHTVNIAVQNGLISKMGNEAIAARQTLHAEGCLLLPAFVDAHVHLDKTYVPLENRSGTLREAIKVWVANKPTLTRENYLERALKAVRQAVASGTGCLRTHVDIDESGNYLALEAILELREQVRGLVDIQIVALGNAGSSPAATSAMEGALALGADLVGGAPALAERPEVCIDTTFDLAEAFDKDIDLHIDETEDPAVLTLEYLAEQTLERGFAGRVTAGHCCSLAFVEENQAARVIDKVAAAQINIVTLPSCNLVLMGRSQMPTPRGLTRVKALVAAGVNVVAASDNVRDPFNPFGSYNSLVNANFCAHAAHMTNPAELLACLDMVTVNAARLTGRSTTVEVGAAADLVLLNATSAEDTVTSLPECLAVIHAGELVFERQVKMNWPEESYGPNT